MSALKQRLPLDATEQERAIWRRKATEEIEAICNDFVARGILEAVEEEWSSDSPTPDFQIPAHFRHDRNRLPSTYGG